MSFDSESCSKIQVLLSIGIHLKNQACCQHSSGAHKKVKLGFYSESLVKIWGIGMWYNTEMTVHFTSNVQYLKVVC